MFLNVGCQLSRAAVVRVVLVTLHNLCDGRMAYRGDVCVTIVCNVRERANGKVAKRQQSISDTSTTLTFALVVLVNRLGPMRLLHGVQEDVLIVFNIGVRPLPPTFSNQNKNYCKLRYDNTTVHLQGRHISLQTLHCHVL